MTKEMTDLMLFRPLVSDTKRIVWRVEYVDHNNKEAQRDFNYPREAREFIDHTKYVLSHFPVEVSE